MTQTQTAWDLIGFDGEVDGRQASVRLVGGWVLYEAVVYNDSTPGQRVRLDRLTVGPNGLHVVNRYVDPETLLEVVLDEGGTR